MSAPDSIIPMKTCTKCGEKKHRAAFPRDPRGKDGLDKCLAQCKACISIYQREYRDRNREKAAAYQLVYRAENPDYDRAYRVENAKRITERERAYRRSNAERIAAYNSDNREKILERQRAYRAANPEKRAADRRNRRARIAGNGGTHTAADIQAQYDRQKGKCFYCEARVGDDYHVDHVMPIILGGSNGPENLVVTCPPCNRSKNAKHPIDFCGRLF